LFLFPLSSSASGLLGGGLPHAMAVLLLYRPCCAEAAGALSPYMSQVQVRATAELHVLKYQTAVKKPGSTDQS
jgi:Tfp pilus assembly protein PilP